MCGIAGFIDIGHGTTGHELKHIVTRMTDALIHRGPDDSGVWADEGAGIALGHRRLSILDLSPEGHQPMSSASGRFIMVFNGEIYNFKDIRQELCAKGCAFRGSSDTEVMLAAFEEWGLLGALERFNGMFAFALWDKKEHALHLVRDRMGEKPIYYSFLDGTFLFASELKAFRQHPAFIPQIDRDALLMYLRLGCIPAPLSIYRNVQKLPPASVLTFLGDEAFLAEPRAYWSVADAVRNGQANPFTGNIDEASEELDALLRDAVSLRMVADVPLGAFLSGGIDSSVVVALMQQASVSPVRTFTIGFDDPTYNEGGHAQSLAKHLGTKHTELYVTAREAMDVIPKLSSLYDEPFADSSQIPTFLVSQLARRSVTVALSGDGGDELFGGYNRYMLGPDIWNISRRLPKTAHSLLAWPINSSSIKLLNMAGWPLRWITSRYDRPRSVGDKLHKLSNILPACCPDDFYQRLVSLWQQPERLVVGMARPPKCHNKTGDTILSIPDTARDLMYRDAMEYLPNDILVKLDRASMGVSLESRVPLLDHRIVEFSWRLPLNMKVSGGRGKVLLRHLLCRYVPKDLFERPKMGFGMPIGEWLKGPLREWAEELLSKERIERVGLLNPAPIRQAWQEHLAGSYRRDYEMWTVLMFQAWHNEWM